MGSMQPIGETSPAQITVISLRRFGAAVGEFGVLIGREFIFDADEGDAKGRIEKKWCGREDSNLHGIATASPSSWCVCQFRHYRTSGDKFILACNRRGRKVETMR